jgi:hypothetical protein
VARLFILFLIASLPLRGWAVETMAFQMDSEWSSISAPRSVDSGTGEECALHMQRDSTMHGSETGHNVSTKGCQSCQLCMALAALDLPAALLMTTAQQTVPVLGTADFASADTARHAKPPIS